MRQFTEDEANKIRILIKQKLRSSTTEQKGIRKKIRDIKFYFSDFSNKKRYTDEDFDQLIKSGQVKIISGESHLKKETIVMITKTPQKEITKSNTKDENIEHKLFAIGNFKKYNDLDTSILDKSGFYCLRLKENSRLPDRYQIILDKHKEKYLYIGKAEGQTLRERL